MSKRISNCHNCGQPLNSLELIRTLGNCPHCGKLIKTGIPEDRSNKNLIQTGLQPKGIGTEESSENKEAKTKEPISEEGNLKKKSPISRTDEKNTSREEEFFEKRRPGRFKSSIPEPEDIIVLQIIPVQGVNKEIEGVTQLINSLSAVAPPIIFELAGVNQRRFIIVRCKRKHVDEVKDQITGAYGSPNIIEIDSEEDPATYFSERAEFRGYVNLVLARSLGLPIKTYRELSQNDSVASLFTSLAGLKENEASMIQFVVHKPAEMNWASKYRQELLEIRRRHLGQIGILDYFRILSLIIGSIGMFAYILYAHWVSGAWILLIGLAFLAFGYPALSKNTDIEWSESLEEMVLRKIEQPGYHIEIRLAAASNNKESIRKSLKKMEGAFRIFSLESGNSFVAKNSEYRFFPNEIQAQKNRTFILGDIELATLWHLPLDDIPDLMSVKKYQHRMVDSSDFATSGPEWPIGISSKSSVREIVKIPQETILNSHALLLGMTGAGKSTVLERMVVEVAKHPGRGLVVIDPHSDMVERLLGLIPPERVGDVIYWDFGSKEYIPALNILDVHNFDGDAEKTVAAFLEVATSLFGKYWGPRMEVPFERVMLALALMNTSRPPAEQYTIHEAIPILLMNKFARREFLDTEIPDNVMKKPIINYFLEEFDTRTSSFIEQVASPVLSKLRPFESNSYLLAAFGQPESSVNLIREIQKGKIIFVRTGTEVLSEEYSNFVGSIILNYAKRAIIGQQTVSPKDRTKITVVVDESQMFSGFDFGTTLAMVRKFGGNFFITSQGVSFIGRARSSNEQDRPQAFNQVMANISTRIIFRLSGYDAVVIADTEFSDEMKPSNLINLPDHNAFLQFIANKNVHGPILVETLPPLEMNLEVRDSILASRHFYSKDFGEAIKVANNINDRVTRNYFRNSEEDNPQLGGEENNVSGEIKAIAGPAIAIPKELRAVVSEGIRANLTNARLGTPEPIRENERLPDKNKDLDLEHYANILELRTHDQIQDGNTNERS